MAVPISSYALMFAWQQQQIYKISGFYKKEKEKKKQKNRREENNGITLLDKHTYKNLNYSNLICQINFKILATHPAFTMTRY